MAPESGGRETLVDLRHCVRRPAFLALSVAPPAAAGLWLEERIERRLGTPATIAVGLVAGSVAMLAADRREPTRSFDGAGATDGLALGIAQASALFPGVSRSGATIAAARVRGWGHGDALRVANLVGLPVTTGAAALKGLRILQRPPARGRRAAMAVGALGSFGSAWLVAPRLARSKGASMAPYACYRLALAVAIAARLRRNA